MGKKSCIFVWKAVRIGEIFFCESFREMLKRKKDNFVKHEAHEGREERIKYKLYPAERKDKRK